MSKVAKESWEGVVLISKALKSVPEITYNDRSEVSTGDSRIQVN